MKKSLLYFIAVLILFLVAVRIIGIRSSYVRAEVMGTGVEVKGANASAAVSEIKRLDNLLSNFNPESEVSLINAAAGKQPISISKDTYQVIDQAYQLSKLSNGAFDITLGKKGNYQDIILNPNLRQIYLRRGGMKIDLGGIGKGYAVESARKILLSKGTKKALIDMYSSIAAIGGPWKIGVQRPTSDVRSPREILGTIILNDGDALSTSAQYEQAGHIIDPRSGKVANQCLSVTIIGKDAGFVDALSTAVFVLGPVEGMKLVKSLPDIKTIIVDKDGKIHDNFGFKLRQLIG